VHLSTAVTAGRLQATIAAGTSTLLPGNRLQSLTFTRLDNAIVDVPGQPSITGPGPVVVTLPNGTPQMTCFLRRLRAGSASTAEVAVMDHCGSWKTFFGGGVAAPF
jgi:hypothetical protein